MRIRLLVNSRVCDDLVVEIHTTPRSNQADIMFLYKRKNHAGHAYNQFNTNRPFQALLVRQAPGSFL
jgi:hypothetical protein